MVVHEDVLGRDRPEASFVSSFLPLCQATCTCCLPDVAVNNSYR